MNETKTIALPTVPGTPFDGGIYAGVTRGDDGQPAGHLILLHDLSGESLTWPAAVKWAEGLGNGARLPTRFESALLYANVRDNLDTDRWHWTGTQFSEADAWFQDFLYGGQSYGRQGAKARARAVRLIQLTP